MSQTKEAHRQYMRNRLSTKEGKLKRQLAGKRRRLEWLKFKSNFSCSICGETNKYCISFHHKDPNTRENTISYFAKSHRLKVLEEMKKCIPICENCHRKIHRLQFASTKNSSRKRKREIRELLHKIKSDIGCKNCGEKDPICLDFHHTGESKKFRISQASAKSMSNEKIKSEIEKCIILCANCHLKEHNLIEDETMIPDNYMGVKRKNFWKNY